MKDFKTTVLLYFFSRMNVIIPSRAAPNGSQFCGSEGVDRLSGEQIHPSLKSRIKVSYHFRGLNFQLKHPKRSICISNISLEYSFQRRQICFGTQEPTFEVFCLNFLVGCRCAILDYQKCNNFLKYLKLTTMSLTVTNCSNAQ